MITQEVVGNLLAMLKGGSVWPSSQTSPCSTVPSTVLFPEQTTDVESCEETNALTQNKKIGTTEHTNSKRLKHAFEELAHSSRSVSSAGVGEGSGKTGGHVLTPFV